MERINSGSPLGDVRMPPQMLQSNEQHCAAMIALAHQQYNAGRYKEAQATCEQVYRTDAYRTGNLLLLGAVHFQLRNFSECIFYNQQCIRVDPNFAEAYGNLGNALKELGDVAGAVQFYLKALKLKPRFSDAYNNLASAYMQLGQTKEAIETFKMALVLNPSLVDAHSNLGNLLKASGRLAEAHRCYMEAIRIQPGFAIAWSNLAGCLKDEGQLESAIAYYREAIRLCPEFADAHSNLGNALKESGRVDEAMQSYREAIRLRPSFAIAHGNLASCHYDRGELPTAIRAFKHAIQLEPNFPDAYNNLGNALRETGKLEEAINCYRTALRLKPDHPHAYNNLGNALKDRGMVKESIHCYMTAARLMPRFAAAHSNLGSILKEQGKLEQALAHYQEAITIDPLFADAYSNMGNAYKDLGRLDDAVKCYTTALRINPSFADAYSNLASAYKDGGRMDDAIKCYEKALVLKPDFPDAFANYLHSLVFVCSWAQLPQHFNTMRRMLQQQLAPPGQLTDGSDATDNNSSLSSGGALPPGLSAAALTLPSVQPFHALVYPISEMDMLSISARYAARCRANVALLDCGPFRFKAKRPQERLRVGYVSSDLGNHPLSHLMQSVFGLHDKSKLEVTCYALSPDDRSEWRRKICGEVEHFKDVSMMGSADVARLIHADGVHVLVNLNGYTKGARNEIFALQPAPVQVSYMGFCASMGAEYVQYMIADAIAVPKDRGQYYSEKIVRMPHSYFVNDHRQSAREVLDPDRCPSRAAYGLPEDKFVFCNFNQLYKIDPSTFDMWCSILKRVPNSVLWLLRFPPLGEVNIRAEARARGVGDDRLHFTDVAPKDEHLKRGYLADLFLDTPACNAHTTGCDILWGGTPLLTLKGDKMATRVASSLLTAAGVPELITHNPEEYEELAVALAHDMDRLWELRKRLEAGRDSCALFDTPRWTRNLEAGLSMVWAAHERGMPPADIDVPDVAEPTLPTVVPDASSAPAAAVVVPGGGTAAVAPAGGMMGAPLPFTPGVV